MHRPLLLMFAVVFSMMPVFAPAPASAEVSESEKVYHAARIAYNPSKIPSVERDEFKCRVKRVADGNTRFFEIKLFPKGKFSGKPELIIKLAFSNRTASTGIYDGDDKLIRTLPDGVVMGESLALFNFGGDEPGGAKTYGKWIVSNDSMTSVTETVDKNGTLVFGEYTYYGSD